MCQLTGFRRCHGEHQQWPLEARGAELVVPAQGAGEGGAAERVCALRVHRAEARGLALGGADPHPAVAAGADELVDAHGYRASMNSKAMFNGVRASPIAMRISLSASVPLAVRTVSLSVSSRC